MLLLQLASYMIEGGPSKNYNKTKAFMYTEPKAWFALMDKLADMTITYVKAQIDAGAKAIQIFDSWVGALNVADYRTLLNLSWSEFSPLYVKKMYR